MINYSKSEGNHGINISIKSFSESFAYNYFDIKISICKK